MSKTNSNLIRLTNQKYNKYIIKASPKTIEENSFFFFQNLALLNFFYTFLKLKNIFIKNVKIYRANDFVFFFISFYYLTSYKNMFKKIRSKTNTSGISTNCSLTDLLTETLNIYTKKKLNFFFIFQNTNKFLIKYKFLFKSKTFLRKFIRNINFLMKKYKKFNPFIKNLINIFIIFLKKKQTAQLLVDYISYFFQFHKFKKQHRQFLTAVKKLFLLIINNNYFTGVKGVKIKISGRISGKNRAKSFIFFNFKNVPTNTFNAKITYAANTAFTKNGTLGIKLWVYEKK